MLGLAISLAAAASFAQTAGSVSPELLTPRLGSPLQHYSLKLTAVYDGPLAPMGLVLKARVNGGPALRLLLDSGAQDIALSRKEAARMGLSGQPGLHLVGMGASLGTAVRLSPGRMESGGLVLENCPMFSTDAPMREGIDGVVPLWLFAGFMVRLDVPHKTLDLEPFDDSAAPGGDTGFRAVRAHQGMLFLEARMNESATGYMLLDTGAVYNGISPGAARAWPNYRLMGQNISLASSSGDLDGLLLPPGVEFRLGSHVLKADPAVVVDLSAMSKLHAFEVSGVIGYPALRGSVVTIDYRDGLVRVDGK